MRLLGLDIGAKRTGIAVADTETGIASPVGIIEAPAPSHDLLRRIRETIDEHAADAIVIGLPLNMDGSDGEPARNMRRLAETVRLGTGIPVHLHDERLTSDAADQRMARSGLTHRQKKARRDAIAASEILSGFLAGLHEIKDGDPPPTRNAADHPPGG